jgi:hypothetical protein
MPILLLILGIGVFAYLWVVRRNSTLTRHCKWRLRKDLGSSTYVCVACNARCDPGAKAQPNHCLRKREDA